MCVPLFSYWFPFMWCQSKVRFQYPEWNPNNWYEFLCMISTKFDTIVDRRNQCNKKENTDILPANHLDFSTIFSRAWVHNLSSTQLSTHQHPHPHHDTHKSPDNCWSWRQEKSTRSNLTPQKAAATPEAKASKKATTTPKNGRRNLTPETSSKNRHAPPRPTHQNHMTWGRLLLALSPLNNQPLPRPRLQPQKNLAAGK